MAPTKKKFKINLLPTQPSFKLKMSSYSVLALPQCKKNLQNSNSPQRKTEKAQRLYSIFLDSDFAIEIQRINEFKKN